MVKGGGISNKAETVEGLAEQAARAEANGFPYGVSTKQADKLRNTDLVHKVADKGDVEKVFEVQKTGSSPSHHTVLLPKPITQEVADQFNQTFIPPSLRKPQ